MSTSSGFYAEIMSGAVAIITSAVITVLLVFLTWYSRLMTKRGVLR